MTRDDPEIWNSPVSSGLTGFPSAETILWSVPGKKLPTLANFGIPYRDAEVIATAVDIS